MGIKVNIANTEIDMNYLVRMQEYFTIRMTENCEIFLTPNRDSYTPGAIMHIADIIGNLRADEVSIEGHEIRLWWD